MPENVVPMGELRCRVLEAKPDQFRDQKTGQMVNFTTFVVRTTAGMVKIRPNKDFDFTPYLDKDITLEVGMQIFNLQPALIALGVKGAKKE